MSAPRKKPVHLTEEKQPLDDQFAPDEQSQPDDEQPAPQDEPRKLKPAQDLKLEMPTGIYEVPGNTAPENLTVEWVREHGTFSPLPESEPSEEVRKFVALIHLNNHKAARGKQFEPTHGVVLQFGYNGLLRLRGHNHVHIATVDELAEMSDQQVYDAVMAAGKSR